MSKIGSSMPGISSPGYKQSSETIVPPIGPKSLVGWEGIEGSGASGEYSLAVGFGAGRGLSQGIGSSIAIGYKSLESKQTGGSKIAIGVSALENNGVGIDSVAIGSSALHADTKGSSEVAVGVATLLVKTVGSANVAVGGNASAHATDAESTVSMGYLALGHPLTTSNSVAIGTFAAGGNTESEEGKGEVVESVIIGYEAMITPSEKSYRDVIIGSHAANGIKNSEENVAIGFESLWKATTSKENVAIGAFAGSHLASGSKSNIVIGNAAGPSAAEESEQNHQLYIGWEHKHLIRGDLELNKLGFFGHAPVALPKRPATLEEVITTLEELGLVAA